MRIPTSEVDLEAARVLQRPGLTSKAGLILNLHPLIEEFPESHYNYAAHWTGGDALQMLNAVILQPDNPLNPWVAAAMAEGLARRKHPCAPPRRPHPLGEPPDLQERYERVIAAYPPPEPVKAYLEQVERELAAEECPAKENASKTPAQQPEECQPSVG